MSDDRPVPPGRFNWPTSIAEALARIEVLRESLIDCTTVVDDRRRELVQAEQERADVIIELESLLAWVEGRHETPQ